MSEHSEVELLQAKLLIANLTALGYNVEFTPEEALKAAKEQLNERT